MILLASTWLCLSLLLCIFAWYAGRWIALTLPLAAIITAFAIWVPTGSPRYTPPPPGDYRVVGADIQPSVAIYVLLKLGSAPAVFYKLPYSASRANELQGALDGEGGVQAKVNGEGGVSYDGEMPVTGDEPKQPETPAVSLP